MGWSLPIQNFVGYLPPFREGNPLSLSALSIPGEFTQVSSAQTLHIKKALHTLMASGCILVIALCNAVDISVNWFLRRSDGIDYNKQYISLNI